MVAYLIFEACFEHQPILISELRRDGFGPNPFFGCFVAVSCSTDAVVGYCLYFFSYSSMDGKRAFMQDLLVTENFRAKGVGKSLWKELVKVL